VATFLLTGPGFCRMLDSLDQLCIYAASVVKPCRKHGNDFLDVLGKILFERGVLASVENHHFNLFGLADG
jgi:hypothetical protein